MKKSLIAIAAVAMMFCAAPMFAADGDAAVNASASVPQPPKAYSDMTVNEMVAFFNELSPEQLADVVTSILDTNDLSTIDKAGQAFAIFTSSIGTDRRSMYASALSANLPGFSVGVGEGYGMFISSGNNSSLDSFFYGMNSAFAINALPGSPAANIPGGAFDNPDISVIDVKNPRKPYPVSGRAAF